MQDLPDKEALTFEKVWLMFQETAKRFQETDKKFQETDKKFQETDKRFQETDKKFQETDKRFQETDKKFQETSKEFQETKKMIDAMSKESNKRIKKLEELFVGQWGKLVESLVEGSLVRLLNQKGIMVQQTFQRSVSRKAGKEIEIDILACNGEEVVAVEVKTTLNTDDVKEFIEKLKLFKQAFPQYSHNRIYGAVAFIRVTSDAHRYAEKKGLFVIKATGSSAKIINDENFKPTVF